MNYLILVGVVLYYWYCPSLGADADTHTPNRLPAADYMSKIYNVLLGTEIYDQIGKDIISYHWDTNRITSGDHVYEVPREFDSIPNINPICHTSTKLNSIRFSASTKAYKEQAESTSDGFEQNVDLTLGLSAGPVTAEAQTSYSNILRFSNTDDTKSLKAEAKAGSSMSFSLTTKSTLYKAEIDWSHDNGFKFNPHFIADIQALDTHHTPKDIFTFINIWGTHVLKKMEAGSYCKETAYAASGTTKSQMMDFHSHVSTNTEGFLFWKSSRETSNVNMQTSHTFNGNSYAFKDIYCKGEVAVTTMCGGLTGTMNSPIVTAYELLPFWEIKQIREKYFTDNTIRSIDSFFNGLFSEMDHVAKNWCDNYGAPALKAGIWNDAFINGWSGDYLDLFNLDQCVCDDEAEGHDCKYHCADPGVYLSCQTISGGYSAGLNPSSKTLMYHGIEICPGRTAIWCENYLAPKRYTPNWGSCTWFDPNHHGVYEEAYITGICSGNGNDCGGNGYLVQYCDKR